jgi:hypothetical protein
VINGFKEQLIKSFKLGSLKIVLENILDIKVNALGNLIKWRKSIKTKTSNPNKHKKSNLKLIIRCSVFSVCKD